MPAWATQKTIQIDAPVSKVYSLVSDFHTWTAWSPWLIADPKTKVEVTQTSDQIGSKYHWTSDIVGEGELEHKTLELNKYVECELRFIRPMKSVCKTAFQLHTVGDKTEMTWSIDGNLPWYLFWLRPTIIAMIGMDYHRGLSMIRDLAQQGSIPSRTEVIGVESFPAIRLAGFPSSGSFYSMGDSMAPVIQRIDQEYREEGLPKEGTMVAVYTRFDMQKASIEYILGRAIPETLIMPSHSKLTDWRHPACRALHVRHIGSYEHLGNAWSVANRIAQHQKLKLSRCAGVEMYTTHPADTPKDQYQTDVYLPLR